MSTHRPFEAIYKNGLLRPLTPLELQDDQQVSLAIVDGETAPPCDAIEKVERQRRAHEELARFVHALPDGSPDDGWSAADHDEVLYGWKK